MRAEWNDLRRAEPRATRAPEVTQAACGQCAVPGQPSPAESRGPGPVPSAAPQRCRGRAGLAWHPRGTDRAGADTNTGTA